MITASWHNRDLVWELVKREFTGRYQGSFGGLIWSFAQPLFLLTVYTIAFGYILKARWGFSGGTAEYALMLFAGLIIFNAFSECLTKAPTLITKNPNFVKKILFPLEILPVVMVVSTMLHVLVSLSVWILGYIFLFGVPKLTVMLFPLILISFVPILLGTGWLLSALGVIVRDINQMTNMISHTLLFLTPIFYSIEAAPPSLQHLLILNPLTFIVEQFRLILFLGQMPSLKGLAVYFLISSLFAVLSWFVFQKLRAIFADLV